MYLSINFTKTSIRLTNGFVLRKPQLVLNKNWFQCSACLSNETFCRLYSSQPPPQRKGFLGQVLDNIKQEMAKNKEMKENIKKFREEAQKLEESDALQKARQKYHNIESETAKGSQQIIEQLDAFKDKISKGLEEAQKTEIGKKGLEMTEEFSKQAKSAAEAFAKQTEQISRSDAFKTVSQTVKAVKEEIEETPLSGAKVYKSPLKLRKRKEQSEHTVIEKPIEPNERQALNCIKTRVGIKVGKNFKDNNAYVNKIFDWKMKYDESDNPVVRASRLITDKVSELFGGIFSKTELSDVLTEICKIDPNFDKNQFLKDCEYDIIPNILEAMIRGDIEILKDWCNEAPFNALATPIKQAKSLGHKFESKILDIMNVDLAMGKMMENGPVLIITFQTQQIMVLKDSKGNIVEGDPEKILRIHYVWVLCRDQNEFDPKAAWKLMDLSANTAQQWL